MAMTDSTAICDQIVDAANARFKHYGYGKTTMAEIAKDCNMSTGNIYRYFPSKLDIAERIADINLQEKMRRGIAIVRDQSKSPMDKLQQYLLQTLEFTYALQDEYPKIQEISQIITAERPEFRDGQLAKERSLIAEILAAGNANREFDIDDIHFTADMILSATFKFRFPQYTGIFSFDRLRGELNGVIDLVLNGLKNKGAHPGPYPITGIA